MVAIGRMEPTFNGRVLLSMDVTEAARAGDPLALERVLRYYDRYIKERSHKVSQIKESQNKVLLGHPDGINSWVYLSEVTLV